MLILKALSLALYSFCASLMISLLVFGCLGGLAHAIMIDAHKVSPSQAKDVSENIAIAATICTGIFVLGSTICGFVAPFSEQSARRRAELQRRKEEQRNRCNQLIVLGDQAAQSFVSLVACVASAERHLNQAEIDLADHAYSPFWSSIENAATSLAHGNEVAVSISSLSSQYGELIRQYDGTTPRFPLSSQSIEKARVVSAATADRMRSVVRRAHRDASFAMIFEQRRTNAILVAGFVNLAQMLDNVNEQIGLSLRDLARAVEHVSSIVALSTHSIKERLIDLEDLVARASSERVARERQALQVLDRIQRGKR